MNSVYEALLQVIFDNRRGAWESVTFSAIRQWDNKDQNLNPEDPQPAWLVRGPGRKGISGAVCHSLLDTPH